MHPVLSDPERSLRAMNEVAVRAREAARNSSVPVAFAVFVAVVAGSPGWAVAITVLAALGCAAYAVAPQLGEERAVAARRRDEIRERADRQHHWVLRGDSRGLYGADGAELMRRLETDSGPADITDIAAADDEVRFAAVAYTAEDLAALIAERPACWRYAVFASVLVQRRAQVQSRLRDQQLSYAPPNGMRCLTGFTLAQYMLNLIEQMAAHVGQIEELMLSPGFTRMFGDPADEDSADAEAIVHAANRLMDMHERLLGLAEDCRGVEVVSEHADVVRACGRLFDAPLEGYRRFIDEFVERVAEMAQVLRYARGHIVMDPIMLHVDDDDRLFDDAFSGLRRLARDTP